MLFQFDARGSSFLNAFLNSGLSSNSIVIVFVSNHVNRFHWLSYLLELSYVTDVLKVIHLLLMRNDLNMENLITGIILWQQ